jgi:hypothetical protein
LVKEIHIMGGFAQLSKRYIPRAGVCLRLWIRHDILATLHLYTDDKGLTVPTEAHMAMARREDAQT